MTKKKRILNHLKSGKTITSMEAIDLFKCTRLAAVIHSLKDEGYSIESKSVKGTNTNYARYKLLHTDKDGQYTFLS
jgi:biotin operon repressor